MCVCQIFLLAAVQMCPRDKNRHRGSHGRSHMASACAVAGGLINWLEAAVLSLCPCRYERLYVKAVCILFRWLGSLLRIYFSFYLERLKSWMCSKKRQKSLKMLYIKENNVNVSKEPNILKLSSLRTILVVFIFHYWTFIYISLQPLENLWDEFKKEGAKDYQGLLF